MALLFQEHESPYHESVAWKLLLQKRALIGIQPGPCFVMKALCDAVDSSTFLEVAIGHPPTVHGICQHSLVQGL
jgi:hypothetical protein